MFECRHHMNFAAPVTEVGTQPRVVSLVNNVKLLQRIRIANTGQIICIPNYFVIRSLVLART